MRVKSFVMLLLLHAPGCAWSEEIEFTDEEPMPDSKQLPLKPAYMERDCWYEGSRQWFVGLEDHYRTERQGQVSKCFYNSTYVLLVEDEKACLDDGGEYVSVNSCSLEPKCTYYDYDELCDVQVDEVDEMLSKYPDNCNTITVLGTYIRTGKLVTSAVCDPGQPRLNWPPRRRTTDSTSAAGQNSTLAAGQIRTRALQCGPQTAPHEGDWYMSASPGMWYYMRSKFVGLVVSDPADVNGRFRYHIHNAADSVGINTIVGAQFTSRPGVDQDCRRHGTKVVMATGTYTAETFDYVYGRVSGNRPSVNVGLDDWYGRVEMRGRMAGGDYAGCSTPNGVVCAEYTVNGVQYWSLQKTLSAASTRLTQNWVLPDYSSSTGFTRTYMTGMTPASSTTDGSCSNIHSCDM